MSAAESLIGEMAALLRSSGVDLTNEGACIRALIAGRFSSWDVSILIDDAMAAARQGAVAAEMARG